MSTTIDFGTPDRLLQVLNPAYLALQKGSTAFLARIRSGGIQEVRFDAEPDADSFLYVSDSEGKAYSNKIRMQSGGPRCVRVTAIARNVGSVEEPVILSPCETADRQTEEDETDGEIIGTTRELCTTVRFADGRTHRSCQTLAPAPARSQDRHPYDAIGNEGETYVTPSQALFKRVNNRIRM